MIIAQYIQDNNLDAIEGPEGLWYTVDSVGNGVSATLADQVECHYEGRLVDGTKFDSSYDRGAPTKFPLSGVIRGWQLGIPKFSEGGGGKLLIPSELGYGNQAVGSIPRNSVLIFTVEVIDVQ